MLWLTAPAAKIMPELRVRSPAGLALSAMGVAESSTRELIVASVAIAVDAV